MDTETPETGTEATEIEAVGASGTGAESTRCPQCGATVDATMWNCPSCRINLYWAHQHYNEIAHIREQQGLQTRAGTPPFLVTIHERVHADRASHGGDAMNKVRSIARRVMLGESNEQP